MKKLKAFTLIEMLIVCIIISIVFVAIVATSISGTNAAFRVINHSKALAGVRFSFDSMPDDLIRKAVSVDILDTKTDSTVIATINDKIGAKTIPVDEAYIYVSGDTVWLTDSGENRALYGSEFIKSMDVSVSKTVDAASSDCYVIYMTLKGHAGEDETSGDFSASRSYALINAMSSVSVPKKMGHENGDLYAGDVLHIKIAPFDFWNLRVIEDGSGMVLGDKTTINKGTKVNLAYNISLPKGAKDATKIQWCLSGTNAPASLTSSSDMSISKNDPNYNNSTNKTKYSWPLLIKTDDNKYRLANEKYISDDNSSLHSINSSGDAVGTLYYYIGGSKDFGGDFDSNGYLTDVNKAKSWGKYGYLRAWVEPRYTINGGSATKDGTNYNDQWSDTVCIGIERAGNSFFTDWVSAISNVTNDSEHSQDDGSSVKDEFDLSTASYETKLSFTKNSKQLSKVAKVISPKYLIDARSYDIYLDKINGGSGRSYTSLTNYSVIVDATINGNASNTTGFAITLNGYQNGIKVIAGAVNGYALFYAPGSMGFPIRLLGQDKPINPNSNQENPVSMNYACGVDELYSPLSADINSITNTQNNTMDKGAEPKKQKAFLGKFFNTQYYIGAIQNEVLSNVPESTSAEFKKNYNNGNGNGNSTKEAAYMRSGEHRFIITVLEYYDSDVNKNRLIVRVRMLKTLSMVMSETGKSELELRAEDPFLTGPQFYYSEPMWFGMFVGQKPVRSGDNYTFKTMRPGDKSALIPRTQRDSLYSESKAFYALQTPLQSGYVNRYAKGYINLNGYATNGGIYKQKALNPYEDLLDNPYPSYPYSYDGLAGLTNNGANRKRWIGISSWGDSPSLTIGEFTIAPGFNGNELKAIMPNGAQMYNMSDTWTSEDLTEYNACYNANIDGPSLWNSVLFDPNLVSNGNGNSNNSYGTRFTDTGGMPQICVMSLQHYGLDTESSPQCPICEAYKIYNSIAEEIRKRIHWGWSTN